jgi:site-specific recombinase XerD
VSRSTIRWHVRVETTSMQIIPVELNRCAVETQIREYQLYLIKRKQCSWAVFNQTVCALRFFYNTTLGWKEMIEEIPNPRFEKRLPVVLSQTEVAALLQASKQSRTSGSFDDHLRHWPAGVRGDQPGGH